MFNGFELMRGWKNRRKSQILSDQRKAGICTTYTNWLCWRVWLNLFKKNHNTQNNGMFLVTFKLVYYFWISNSSEKCLVSLVLTSYSRRWNHPWWEYERYGVQNGWSCINACNEEFDNSYFQTMIKT